MWFRKTMIFKLILVFIVVVASTFQIIGSIREESWSYYYALIAGFCATIFGLNWFSPKFYVPGQIGQFEILVRMILTCYGMATLMFLYQQGKIPKPW
jgi:hypothetical protein